MVGGGHDARVEERAGFEGIFVGEIGADEEFAGLVEWTVDGKERGHFVEPFEKDGADVDVPVVEFGEHVVERGGDGGLIEHEDAGEDVEEAAAGFGMAGRFDDDGSHEGAEEHAPCVGAQFQGLPADVHEAGGVVLAWKAALALSSAFISDSASQKESVDSAPWF